jgi:hypothetical protein
MLITFPPDSRALSAATLVAGLPQPLTSVNPILAGPLRFKSEPLSATWRQNWGAEFKYTDAPTMRRSMSIGVKELNPFHLWVVYSGKIKYRLSPNITVLPLKDICAQWEYH